MQIRSLILVGTVALSSYSIPAQAQTDNRQVTPRIVGGEVVTNPKTYPWMTALLKSSVSNPFRAQICGGSLIKKDWVLTAAHCLDGETPADVDVLLGQLDLNGGGGERIRAKNFVIHPDYKSKRYPDIALIQLTTASKQTPVELLSKGTTHDSAGKISTVMGWGNTSENGSGSPKLQHVSVPIVTNQSCSKSYQSDFNAQAMVCAGLSQGGKDSCYGDSGGPLVVKGSNNKFLQAGVVSFGEGCARPNFPGVYARVSNVNEWIAKQVGDDSNPGPDPDPQPTDGFKYSCKELRCTFTADSPSDSTKIDAFVWNFGNGEWDFGQKLTHDYARSGKYKVTLYAIDSKGSIKNFSHDIKVTGTSNPTPPKTLSFDGRVKQGGKTIVPKDGFEWQKGKLKAVLKMPTKRTDFDLFLEHYDDNYGDWVEVGYSVTDGNVKEVIRLNQAPSGQYRLIVKAYRGKGKFNITVTP